MRKKSRKVDTLFVGSTVQRLNALESIRKHPHNRAKNLENCGFQYTEIARNISCCIQWTCSHRIMHFGNNFNRYGVVGIAVYHMCTPFPQIYVSNYTLRNLDLVLAYDFDNKLTLLRQHFLHSVKTSLSIRLVVSLKVSFFLTRNETDYQKHEKIIFSRY